MIKDDNALNFAPFAAGIFAGANATIVGHPFDTLKTRFQVGRVLTNKKVDLAFMRQLYRGILPPLLTSGAIQSVNFFLFENFRTRLTDNTRGAPIIGGDISSIFVAGTLSGSVVSLVSNPISVVKIRQQIVAAESIRKCVHDIYSTSGMKGFYRGYSTMYLLDASRGLYLAIYEVMKRLITDSALQAQKYAEPNWGNCSVIESERSGTSLGSLFKNVVRPVVSRNDSCDGISDQSNSTVGSAQIFAPNSTSTRMLAAACTGVISWIIIFPIDVVRVRLHLDFERIKYRNWRDCMVKTYAEHGVQSFYRGISYTLIRAGPVSAASLTTYEFAKDAFEQW